MKYLQVKLIPQCATQKKAEWLGDRFKEREIVNAIRQETASYEVDINEVMELVKAQKEYH